MSAISADLRASLEAAHGDLGMLLSDGIVPFWLSRAVDREAGGYRTSFGEDGEPVVTDGDKYVVSQARLVWSFARFARAGLADRGELVAAARHGVDFLGHAFHDQERGGWYWRVGPDGRPLDKAKLIYGQAFVVYALAEYAAVTGDAEARALAESTFDDIVRHALDGAHGGYLENLDPDWNPAAGGSAAGDRKSLDIHLHLLEAFCGLLQLTGAEIHARRLGEVIEIILERMIDARSGAGGNQYSLDFRPLEPIVIDRTWVAERPVDGTRRRAMAETSYGHNLELGWLLSWADQALGRPGAHDGIVGRLAAHAVRWGLDHELGGVYREGPLEGPATDTDKEFWQNAEALPGFLQAYQSTHDERYLRAFIGTWRFAQAHLIEPRLGEWRIRTDRTGAVIAGDLANAWKVSYHSGRSAIEALERLEQVLWC